jgi:TPR repeat protein
MAGDILVLSEFGIVKSAFIDLLLGVSIMPQETPTTNLPVIRFQANATPGFWMKLAKPEPVLNSINRWTEIPKDWTAFDDIEIGVAGHPIFDSEIVLWDMPNINSPLKERHEHLVKFLAQHQTRFSSVLFLSAGVPTQVAVDFLNQWPLLRRRTTLVIIITERKTQGDCEELALAVRDVSTQKLYDIPSKLLYIGGMFEEFQIRADAMRRNYSDRDLLERRIELQVDIDTIARKENVEPMSIQLSNIIQGSLDIEGVNYQAISETVLFQYAENNDADAQYELGMRLLQREDYQGALHYFRVLAEHTHPQGMYALSRMYFDGKGVDVNMDAAVSWNRAAADNGIAEAQYLMYTLLSSGQYMKENAARALSYLKMAATSNHPQACGRYGELCITGIEVPVNYALGVEYLSKAVDAGDANAMVALARSYKQGLGVERNIPEMMKLLENASEFHHAEALLVLGETYFKGLDVTCDRAKAFGYFQRAATAGAAEAQMHLGICYEQGEGIEKNSELAIKHYTLAAGSGNVDAQYTLGNAYYAGILVPKDLEKAKEWLKLAAAAGNIKALDLLQKIESAPTTNATPQNGALCFVVTAAFGDGNAPEVLFFRTFRDTILTRTEFGQKFISWYGVNGPSLARIISGHTVLLKAARMQLRVVQACIRLFGSSK